MKLLRSVLSIRFVASLVFSVFLAHTAAASDDLLLAAREAARKIIGSAIDPKEDEG